MASWKIRSWCSADRLDDRHPDLAAAHSGARIELRAVVFDHLHGRAAGRATGAGEPFSGGGAGRPDVGDVTLAFEDSPGARLDTGAGEPLGEIVERAHAHGGKVIETAIV